MLIEKEQPAVRLAGCRCCTEPYLPLKWLKDVKIGIDGPSL